MQLPLNVIANADDFGSAISVNKAILYCYEQKLINSSSLMVNTVAFDEAVEIIQQFSSVTNVGVHINLAEGKPLTNFTERTYLDGNGNFDFVKVNKKFNILNKQQKASFANEIHAQIDRALSNNIRLTHMDSHCHLHTLPGFHGLFIEAAKKYNLKLRLAQTYSENYLNSYYRKYLNGILKRNNINYSDYFETPQRFVAGYASASKQKITEIMLHPELDARGQLIDHFDEDSIRSWMEFLKTFEN
jgi:predicted glycoside hydrolase/deacetylase ChbG (UPF0249 family)